MSPKFSIILYSINNKEVLCFQNRGRFPYWIVSCAATTNYYILGGLKKIQTDYLSVWRSEAWNESHWVRTKALAMLHPSGGSVCVGVGGRGRESISLPFPAPRSGLSSLAHSPSSTFWAAQSVWTSSQGITLTATLSPSCTPGDRHDHLDPPGSPWILSPSQAQWTSDLRSYLPHNLT